MNSNARYVFDANVIISAMLFCDSVPGRALIQAQSHGVVLISQSLIDELNEVLGREKFNRYVEREERERFIESLIHSAELVEISERVQICRDIQDDRILELAINGNATIIVTGDQDLLVIRSFRNIPIVTPAEWLELFHGETPEIES